MAISETGKENNETGWLLLFDAKLPTGHPLQNKLKSYRFFDYKINEALHLSPVEESIISDLFNNIDQEYRSSIDVDSKSILLSNLELLLMYSGRFYKRQFVLRNDIKSSFVDRFEDKLNKYFDAEASNIIGIPIVSYFAKEMHISPNYLSDILRALTGKSTLQHIHLKVIEFAKIYLIDSQKNISEIAYDLGFEDAAYFIRFFKSKVGMSPSVYRRKEV